MSDTLSGANRFFYGVTTYPRLIVALGILLIVVEATFLPSLVKDTSADAFISNDNPAMVYREHVKDVFGLEDPFVVAVINPLDGGVFNPDSLELVRWLTDHIMSLDNIDPEKVTSLATENDMRGTIEGMTIEPFLQPGPITVVHAQKIREAIARFPLYQGSLVARDGSAAVIVAESLNEHYNRATYDALMRLIEDAPKGLGDTIFVAGEGAASGYLGDYIDSDMQRLNPMTGVVITLMLLIAFRTIRGMLLPNIIVIATVVGAIGTMAAAGVSFYVITNGLIAILIGISVADSIHIFSRYYELIRQNPNDSQRQLVVNSMVDMWRPVTVTTFTSIAGFAGLFLASTMPPMQYFGVFASVGIFIAWVYSMVFLPAIMSLLSPKPSPVFRTENSKNGLSGHFLNEFGRIVLRRARLTLVVATIVAIVGCYGASRVIVEDQRIDNFQSDEPIYLADKAINRHIDGVYYFDIVVETPEREGLFDPQLLRRIEALQQYAEKLPHVNGSTSVVDYIKKMYQAVNKGDDEAYRIPDSPSLIAQLFLLYSASANPTDFEEEIDYDYRQALIRLYVDTGSYQNNRQLVPALQNYIEKEFNTSQIQATLTGRLQLDFHWIDNIAKSHVGSLLTSLVMVWLMAALLFRSIIAGVYVLLPVGAAILLVYAVMGFGGISMGVGTSMFAAISIGLGVDFAIHAIDKLRGLMADTEDDFDDILLQLYPSTGRALFFNFLALALGFLVLTVSEVPSLINFGALVAVAVASAFLASMTLLPALAKLFRPRFLTSIPKRDAVASRPSQMLSMAAVGTCFVGILIISLYPKDSLAGDSPNAKELMLEINARDEGVSVVRNLRMELTDRRGIKRVRETKVFRKYYGDEKRIAIFYESPSNVRGTSFLTYDYQNVGRDDDQWLYLPGLRKVRRISASDRGDYFLGTDFTYDDIKNENKVVTGDYHFEIIGHDVVDGIETMIVEGKPVDEATAKELGYGKVRWFVDREIRYSRRTEAWDINGNHLKTTSINEFELVDGIWTAMRLSVVNHKTGHQTIFVFSHVDYEEVVPDRIFSHESLRRGFY